MKFIPAQSLTRIHGLLVRAVCALIHLYRASISPVLPASCRFTPSCARYADASFRKYGLLRGGMKTAFRILRCAPWSAGGIDEP